MRRVQIDKKSIAVVILVIALAGLGIVQYAMIRQYYNVSRLSLEQQISATLSVTQDENFDRTLLSNLLSAIITKDTVTFPVGIDSLQRAGTRFYRMYLTDRFTRASTSIPVDFEFAVRDHITMVNYLESNGYSGTDDWQNRYRMPLAGVIAEDCKCAPYLDLRFQSLRSEVIQGMRILVLPALACFVLMILGFILLLRILREQKFLDRVKNDFINNLTHELKTPVFSISLAAKLIREKGPSENYLQQIEKDVDQLKGTVDKVLELASIEHGRNILNLEKFSLKSLLSRWKNASGETGDRIIWDINNSEDIQVTGDQQHLLNALKNLTDNALKYDINGKPVHVAVRKEGSVALVDISDEGPGIDKSEQEAVFSKFYRVNNAHATARGYGLGLTYTKQVIEMMNGKITLKSVPGKGSTFTIELPAV